MDQHETQTPKGRPFHRSWFFAHRKLVIGSMIAFIVVLTAEILMHLLLPPLASRLIVFADFSKSECLRTVKEVGYDYAPGRCGRNQYGIIPTASFETDHSEAPHILLLGDSVSDRAPYATKLQKLIDLGPESDRFRIWNAAVIGYTPTQEFQMMKRHFDHVRPKLVLLQLCPNDLATESEVVLIDPKVKFFLFNARGQKRPWFETAARFRLADYALFWLYADKASAQFRNGNDLKTVLAQFRGYLESKKTPAAVLIFPYFGSDEKSILYRDGLEIVKTVHDSGLPFFEVEKALPKPLDRYQGAGHDVIHPNALGHTLAGEAVFEYLKKNRFFLEPDRTSPVAEAQGSQNP